MAVTPCSGGYRGNLACRLTYVILPPLLSANSCAVQAVAQRPQCRTIVFSEYGDVAVIFSDWGGVGRKTPDGAAAEQPNQAGRVIAAQPPVRRVRLIGRLVQAEQVR